MGEGLRWALVFLSLAAPVGSLVIDRILGIPARRLFGLWGLPSLGAFLIGILSAAAVGDPLSELVAWGAIGGLVATAALDVVRLIGVALGAFPMDMPSMFGLIALGQAPRFQRQMMAQMVAHLAALPPEAQRAALRARLEALSRLPEPMRVAVVGAMQGGLMRLPEPRRQAFLIAQMGVLAELSPEVRSAVMRAMDRAMTGVSDSPVYGQPRGLPRIEMALFRRLAAAAFPETLKEARLPVWKVRLVGYLWHFLIGATFGITYTLLFGHGTWALAFLWGAFVWLAMMVLMPPMMPLIRFPWWFPIVPFLAHMAMAVPIGFFASLISASAHLRSLTGWLGWIG
ncbi:hypothetical protein HRbin22_01003 [Candidatus Thermoflexus japonica]|uniref:Uncharacterized protein n=1 Tax=Candidatus Thermoflexus japonica TaxID=2035417 RepID=A0A2H5Y5T6_9CHLR|nr:hypothetical protein HRbin22_01003 [Candidatus Thermoflexus japonica]